MNKCLGISIIMLLSIVSCFSISEDGENVGTIHISSVLQVQTHDKSVFLDYGKLLKKAIEGTPNDLKSFCLMDFDAAAFYDHGGVLVCLIDSIGEKSFIKAIQIMDYSERCLLRAYLRAGLEYGPKSYTLGEIKKYHKYYPLIAEQLGEL